MEFEKAGTLRFIIIAQIIVGLGQLDDFHHHAEFSLHDAIFLFKPLIMII